LGIWHILIELREANEMSGQGREKKPHAIRKCRRRKAPDACGAPSLAARMSASLSHCAENGANFACL
jgi:hypothetical protein